LYDLNVQLRYGFTSVSPSPESAYKLLNIPLEIMVPKKFWTRGDKETSDEKAGYPIDIITI
jgi:hypothetical protein